MGLNEGFKIGQPRLELWLVFAFLIRLHSTEVYCTVHALNRTVIDRAQGGSISQVFSLSPSLDSHLCLNCLFITFYSLSSLI